MTRFRTHRVVFALVTAHLAVSGCAKSAGRNYAMAVPPPADYGYGGMAEELAYDQPEMAPMAPSPTRGASTPKRMPSADSDSSTLAPPPPPPPPPGEPPAPEPTEVAAPQRMVHYDGYAQLRVANPVDLLDEVVALAESVGGRTENLSGRQVSVRVPVAVFEDTFRKVLALGDVMHKTIRADDVTDQFLAVDLRVSNLKTTRARLVDLLAKATDENEKLRLLAEITRVTEELDAFQSQLRTLSDLAAMSRISVDAVPREAFANADNRPELHGFEWIRSLSPFNQGIWTDDKRVNLVVPDGLVALSKTGPFSAESADGVRLWTMRIDNDPVGDAAFWIDTVQDRIAPEFTNPSERTLGAWACVELDQPGSEEPYHWSVCVRTAGNKLDVAQVYYPSAELVERYGKAVEASLVGGGDT